MHSDLSSWLRRVGCAVALALLSARSYAAEPLAEACAKLTALAGPHFMVREARFTPAEIEVRSGIQSKFECTGTRSVLSTARYQSAACVWKESRRTATS